MWEECHANGRDGSAGLFSAPNLLPGQYRVEVVLAGFQAQSKVGLVLSIGQTITTNFVLQPGSQQEKVTVVDLAQQLIDTTTSSLGRWSLKIGSGSAIEWQKFETSFRWQPA